MKSLKSFGMAGLFVAAGLTMAGFAQAQPFQTVGQDLKGAGHDTAAAGKTVGQDTAHVTKKAYHKTVHGTKTGYHKTVNGTKHVVHKVEGKPTTP